MLFQTIKIIIISFSWLGRFEQLTVCFIVLQALLSQKIKENVIPCDMVALNPIYTTDRDNYVRYKKKRSIREVCLSIAVISNM